MSNIYNYGTVLVTPGAKSYHYLNHWTYLLNNLLFF